MASALNLDIGSPIQNVGFPGVNNFTLNQSTDAVEWIFQAWEAATITGASFRYGVRTGTPPTYRLSLQGVDASGNPDGNILASVTFTPPADATWNGTWRTLTFSASYTCTRGQYLALVIDYSSGTVDGSNNSNFSTSVGFVSSPGIPFVTHNDNGSRTRQGGYPPIVSYHSASKVYGWPYLSTLSQSIASTTEAGIKFTLPAAWGDTYKIGGIHMHGVIIAAAQTLTVTLYEGGEASDKTVLQQVTHDTDISAGNIRSYYPIAFDEVTLSTLRFGNTYRIGLTVSGGSNSISGLVVNSAADFDAWPLGQQFMLTSRTGSGDWTDTATSRPFMDVVLAEIDKGGGTGSIFSSPIIRGVA